MDIHACTCVRVYRIFFFYIRRGFDTGLDRQARFLWKVSELLIKSNRIILFIYVRSEADACYLYGGFVGTWWKIHGFWWMLQLQGGLSAATVLLFYYLLL